MVSSMTGFGQADNDTDKIARIKVEIRSVNHRYLDISVRMSRGIQALEDKVRRSVQRSLGRGRVEIFITRHESEGDNVSVLLDRSLTVAYIKALEELKELCSLDENPDMGLLCRLPDVLRVEKQETSLEEIWEQLEPVLEKALSGLIEQRKTEGENLAADIMERLKAIKELVAQVDSRSPIVVEEYRRRLEERLQAYLKDIETDQARILTEAAIFADRSSINEELVRLRSHLAAYQQALSEQGPIGRKLDFLTQELFREVNTIGSKANDYDITRLVVDMKTELEKIREQVQNIE
ncbi:MAG: YicC family protein [Dethiobacter sp.]|jgi:uncharacterized protein (TIGR00255 family)|nr:YicC family protein [Dethiobacter sp.]